MQSALPTLYSFRRCPYAMRARMAVLASRQTVVVREVVLRDKPTALLAASPKGTVPVLVEADGQVIDESLSIMHWALGQNDPERWLDGHDAALIADNDAKFKHHLDRYKYPLRYGSDVIAERNACLSILEMLDKRLASQPYLNGDHIGINDIALMPFVRQCAGVDAAWFAAQPLPFVHDWIAALTTTALFDDAMVRLPPWRPGDADTIFGGAS